MPTRYTDVPLAKIQALPGGQISEPECKMLYWMASEQWTGTGEIVEIGSLYGKSTTCLARGMRDNPHKRIGSLHAYDMWLADDDTEYMLGQLPKGFRGSFRHIFDKNTADFDDILVVHEGDATKADWCGKPIEILFIDCSVSLEFHEAIFKKFYPYLSRGSVVIQQDYFFYRSYYLPLMMERLSPYMQEMGNADTSMVFQLLEKLPERLFDGPLVTSNEDVIESLETLSNFYKGATTVHGSIISTMLVYFYTRLKNKAKAEEWAKRVIVANGIKPDSKPSAIIRNLNNALAGI